MLPGLFRRASRSKTNTKKFVRLELEALESRVVPTTVMVTNTSGDVATAGSLPYEVAKSNANGGYTIQFSNLFNTAQTINLTSQMNVTAPLEIDGPGANLLTITPATGNNQVFNIANGMNPTTISGVTLSNTTGGTAEAIFDYNSDLTVLRSVITGFNNTNSGGYRAGAIFLHLPATLTIGYSTISGNTTTGYGGGIGVNNGGTENIYESTIVGNTATGSFGGGAIYLWGPNTATIKNSTIAGNSAPNSTKGGGISEVNFTGNTLTLSSTIVAQNTDMSNTAPDINQDSGSILAADFSLIGSTAGITAITGANNQTDVSPGFTTFTPSDNGGPTPTLSLPAGSPALTAGTANSFANDQRGPGFPRTVNGSTDIGAFQTQAASPTPSPPSPPAPPAPPVPPAPPAPLSAPSPLSLAVFLGNQELNNQLGFALSLQGLLALPGAEGNLMQAIANAPPLDSALAAEEFHLASDLALFVNSPSSFSPMSPLTWWLAADVLSTCDEIASDPSFHTSDGFLTSTEMLALDLHILTGQSPSQQAAIAALQQPPTLPSIRVP